MPQKVYCAGVHHVRPADVLDPPVAGPEILEPYHSLGTLEFTQASSQGSHSPSEGLILQGYEEAPFQVVRYAC